MQPKYTHNKSNLIKITEDAKRKSRRRLIGSIVLLLVALILLLNITAKVKPIPINPEIVTVKSTSSTPLATQPIASNPVSSKIALAPIVASAAITNNPNLNQIQNHNNITTAPTPNVAPVKNKAITASNTLPFQGKIISTNETTKQAQIERKVHKQNSSVNTMKKADPAAILNANETLPNSNQVTTPTITKTKLYIQFAALSSLDNTHRLQKELATNGISTSIHPINTSKGTLYRLRAGPYNKAEAEQKLKQISAAGHSGIITGN